jgi:hypothetical protein
VESKQFDSVGYVIVDLADVPSIMVSSIVNPEFDFQGRRLQSLDEDAPESEYVSFSVIATDRGGAVIFGWNRASEIERQFNHSFEAVPDDRAPDTVVRFAFEMCSNTFAAPAWWDALTGFKRRMLLKRMETGGVPHHAPNCLMDDGVRVADWAVSRRLHVVAT